MAHAPHIPSPAHRDVRPTAWECRRCGAPLWQFFRPRVIRNAIELTGAFTAGLAIGLPLSWHHVVWLVRAVTRTV